MPPEQTTLRFEVDAPAEVSKPTRVELVFYLPEDQVSTHAVVAELVLACVEMLRKPLFPGERHHAA